MFEASAPSGRLLDAVVAREGVGLLYIFLYGHMPIMGKEEIISRPVKKNYHLIGIYRLLFEFGADLYFQPHLHRSC